MLVKDFMTRHPLMAEPTMPIIEAQRYMGSNAIRHLPIVGDGKRLLGLVTRERLLVDPGSLGSLDIWQIVSTMTQLTVGDVMVEARDVVAIDEGATIEKAAREMVDRGVGCLPVLKDVVLVGIITDTDLLAHLCEMMVVNPPVPAVRVTVRMPNVPGELARLVGAIAAQGWGILSCGGALYAKDPDLWDAVIKLGNVDEAAAVDVLGKVEGQKIVDVRMA
jgi:acetoin utilization protein AcuB